MIFRAGHAGSTSFHVFTLLAGAQIVFNCSTVSDLTKSFLGFTTSVIPS